MAKKDSSVVYLGYRCHCGEYVVVLRVRPGVTIAVQCDISRTCQKGHTSVVKADKLILINS